MKEENLNEDQTDILCVNERGELGELVHFGNELVWYKINGITEHIIFGVYFSFNQRTEY
jgi:hypothetical protein